MRNLHYAFPKTGSLDTPEIAAARALVEAHDNLIESTHDNQIDQVNRFATWIEERLIFADPETALEALSKFEASTVETLPSIQSRIEEILARQTASAP